MTPKVRPFGALLRMLVLLMGLLLVSQAANAACASPNGNVGDQIYASNYNTMVFCDGSRWVSMAGGVSITVNTSGGGATPAGSSADVQFNSAGALAADTGNFTYAGGLLKAPNLSTTAITASGAGTFGTINSTGLGTLGSLIVTGGATITGQASITTISTSLIQVGDNGASCTSGLAGGVRYNSTSNTIDYCSGSAWMSLGPSATTPTSFMVTKGGTNQTVTANTVTKLTWSTKSYDTNNNFDTATGRYTPTIPGKYLVLLQVQCPDSGANFCDSYIKKNGVSVASGASYASNWATPYTSTIIDMNGATDYLEAYVNNLAGTTVNGQADVSYFGGVLISPQGGGSGGTANPAGSTNDVQFNSGGLLAADTGNFTYASSTLSAPSLLTGGLTATGIASITTVSATNISGTLIQAGASSASCISGINGAIRYNTTSNTLQVCVGTAWTSLSSDTTAGGGTPGGATTQVQYNNNGVFAADAGLTYTSGTQVLTASTVSGTYHYGQYGSFTTIYNAGSFAGNTISANSVSSSLVSATNVSVTIAHFNVVAGAAVSGYGGNAITSGTTYVSVSSTGVVGIGGSVDVSGSLATRAYNAGSGTSFDWSRSNSQYTSANCGAMTFSNMSDGGVYQLVITGTSGTCSFTHSGLTVKMPSGHTAVTGASVYTFLRVGANLFVTYMSGY